MGSLVNSSEHRGEVDIVLKGESGDMYVGIPEFYERFFGDVADLKPASQAFFDKCTKGSCPRFIKDEGWSGWPNGTNEKKALSWLGELFVELAVFAGGYKSTSTSQAPRTLLAQPNKVIRTPCDSQDGRRLHGGSSYLKS